MRVDPQLMIEFSLVAEEASFTKAAHRLRVAQPWLSARIRRLEELIGFRLFARTTRQVNLTEKGRQFLPFAQSVAQSAEAATSMISILRRQGDGRLRLGAAPYTKVIRERKELIELFKREQPDASLELVTGWTLHLMELLQEASIDLTFKAGFYDPADYQGIVLRRLGVSATMSVTHPLARKTVLTPADLTGHRVQVFTRSLNPALWTELYQWLNLDPAQIVEAPEMAEGAPDEMSDPTMIAIFFDFGEANPSPTSGIIRIPLAVPGTIPFSLIRKKDQALNSVADDFWNMARQYADAQNST